MADVSEDDRGQLILVGGIVVAFGLVALIVLLNTALFAENIATRGLGPAPDRAYDHAEFAEQSTERILRHEERIEYETPNTALDNTTQNLLRADAAVRARQFQQHTGFATVEPVKLRQGAALVQTDQSRTFTNVSGTDDWKLATTTGIRNFSMTVDAANTATKSDPGNFTVVIEGDGGSGGRWSAEVYSDGGLIEVRTGGTTCTSTDTVATINWTAGTLAGCSFPFAVDDSTGTPLTGTYVLRFVNGSNATGTYHVVVSNDPTDDSVVTTSFGDPATSDNPRLYHAVYSVRLEVRYEESTVEYETHVRVAPGEPERTRVSP